MMYLMYTICTRRHKLKTNPNLTGYWCVHSAVVKNTSFCMRDKNLTNN